MATTIEPEVSEQRPSRGEPAARPGAEIRPATNGGKRGKIFAALGVVLLVLIAGGVRKLIWSRTHVSSDNAQVDGHILPVLPKVGGYVQSIRVEENQAVKAGDTILAIDDNDYAAKLQQADADLERSQPLVEQGVVSRQQLDAAVTMSRGADAALAAAQAALLGADARVAAARASRDWAAL